MIGPLTTRQRLLLALGLRRLCEEERLADEIEVLVERLGVERHFRRIARRAQRHRPPCPACKGEGFIDLGPDARTCADCAGTGKAAASPRARGKAALDKAEQEMLGHALGALQEIAPFNRRLGRAANAAEIVALARKLDVRYGLPAAAAAAEAV